MTRVRDTRESTSISEYNPGTPWGDLGAGAKIIGVAGFDLPTTDPTDGQVATWDAASGQWIWSTPGASSTGMVPYYVAPADTFTVPIYKQAPYAIEIDNQGLLVVDGYLLEVD